VTPEQLKSQLHYDPKTGSWTWLVRRGGRRRDGRAGWLIRNKSTGGGHRYIHVNGRSYMSSHLAWLYMTGKWPVHEIDHRNGIGWDDRFENLREATHSQNLLNQRSFRKNNSSGLKGVSRNNSKASPWRTSIFIAGNRKHLGCFASAVEAYQAYKAASLELCGEFSPFADRT
jgi:hypothetical protein